MQNYISILEKYSDYERNGEMITYSYQRVDNDNLKKIRSLFQFDFNNVNDLEKALILMNFVFRKLIPGNKDYIEYRNRLNVIEIFSASISQSIESNCLMYSICLSELLLAYGIRARVVICRPYNFYENSDCHCMVHAYISNLRKWVAFDPAFNTTYRNKNGVFLSIPEIRQSIIENDEYALFGLSREKADLLKVLKSYYAQYMVIFASMQNNYFNCFSNPNEPFITLFPKEYNKNNISSLSNSKLFITYSDKAFWGF